MAARAAMEAEDLGPAISIEDALTVIIVILILRVVLFVPLIVIDKAKLDHAEKESLWEEAYGWVLSRAKAQAASPLLPSYGDAFEVDGKSVVVGEDKQAGVRYIEAADGGENLFVIRHDLGRNAYSSMFIQKFSNVPSYRHGAIRWSPEEKRWFTLNNRIDYTGTPESLEMQKQYRAWVGARKPGTP